MKYILLFISVLSVLFSNAQFERKYIRSGNDYYNLAEKDSAKADSLNYALAEEEYRKALKEDPNSFEGYFNLGNALLRQKKFEDAANQFKILESYNTGKDTLSKVYHNLGNALLMGGKIDESIEAYKNALRNNPSDKETKYNLAYAQHLKQQQQQQQQQQQDQNQENQDKKDQEQKEQQQQQQKDKQEQQQQEQQQQQQKQEQISKEDAQRILEALQQDEKDLQEKLKKKKVKGQKIVIEKDW